MSNLKIYQCNKKKVREEMVKKILKDLNGEYFPNISQLAIKVSGLISNEELILYTEKLEQFFIAANPGKKPRRPEPMSPGTLTVRESTYEALLLTYLSGAGPLIGSKKIKSLPAPAQALIAQVNVKYIAKTKMVEYLEFKLERLTKDHACLKNTVENIYGVDDLPTLGLEQSTNTEAELNKLENKISDLCKALHQIINATEFLDIDREKKEIIDVTKPRMGTIVDKNLLEVFWNTIDNLQTYKELH